MSLLLLLTIWTHASPLEATMAESARVYHGPGVTYRMVDWITIDTPVELHARNRIGNWVEISWAKKRGWVMLGYVTLPQDFKLSQLEVDDSLPDADVTRVGTDPLDQQLYAIPILPDITPAVCDIYQRGRDDGHYPDRISKVGDSNSVSEYYLAPISRDEFDLGPYDFLQETVNYFKATFDRKSVAARVGMNTASVFDPMWSNPDLCESGESPLACEFNRTQPAAAVIMFGANDTRVLAVDEYTRHMRRLIEETLDANVIPILVMFTISPDDERYGQALQFNRIIAELGIEYQVPVVNFWMAAKALPSAGVGEDNIHLTQRGLRLTLGREESFNGLPLQNLLILHVLDSLHQTCHA